MRKRGCITRAREINDYLFRCGCSKTHFTQIEIDAKNQHGVIIKNEL